ncbi:hypothetical protein VTO42DRAFT_8468 [Malbranchea cinnamomea]
MVRKRIQKKSSPSEAGENKLKTADQTSSKSRKQVLNNMARSRWLLLAIASGTFAALNGLFAKLTTTTLTSSIANGISHIFSLPSGAEKAVEYISRAIFFAFNVLSNIIMWALFTRALTASPSTTKVTITNTSSNFLVTGLLGMIVFGERIAPLWWLGAAAMAAGCILVGMRDEERPKEESDEGGTVEEREILLEGLEDEQR